MTLSENTSLVLRHLILHVHTYTFWEQGKIAELSNDDLLKYDYTSQRIEKLRAELESLVSSNMFLIRGKKGVSNKKNVQQRQHVDVDKNPPEIPRESLYDKETRQSRQKLDEMTKKKKAGQ
jgi:hypothetical protein